MRVNWHQTVQQAKATVDQGNSVLRRVLNPQERATDSSVPYFAIRKNLRNWGDWARGGNGGEHCGSIEWRYVFNRERYEEGLSKRDNWMPIDPGDAERVEEAVVSLSSLSHRQFLRDLYALRLLERQLCRKYGLHFRQLDTVHAKLLGLVDAEYTRICEVHAKRHERILRLRGLMAA